MTQAKLQECLTQHLVELIAALPLNSKVTIAVENPEMPNDAFVLSNDRRIADVEGMEQIDAGPLPQRQFGIGQC